MVHPGTFNLKPLTCCVEKRENSYFYVNSQILHWSAHLSRTDVRAPTDLGGPPTDWQGCAACRLKLLEWGNSGFPVSTQMVFQPPGLFIEGHSVSHSPFGFSVSSGHGSVHLMWLTFITLSNLPGIILPKEAQPWTLLSSTGSLGPCRKLRLRSLLWVFCKRGGFFSKLPLKSLLLIHSSCIYREFPCGRTYYILNVA